MRLLQEGDTVTRISQLYPEALSVVVGPSLHRDLTEIAMAAGFLVLEDRGVW